jgi:hypothetical protein
MDLGARRVIAPFLATDLLSLFALGDVESQFEISGWLLA